MIALCLYGIEEMRDTYEMEIEESVYYTYIVFGKVLRVKQKVM